MTQFNEQERATETYHQDNQEQEEYISDVVELKPQVLWNEGKRCVFGSPDLVPRIRLLWQPRLVLEFVWQGLVEEQSSAFAIGARG